MEKVAGMMMMVRKAGSASAVCSHLMRTTLSIISAPTVISAGPIAYGGTLAARGAGHLSARQPKANAQTA